VTLALSPANFLGQAELRAALLDARPVRREAAALLTSRGLPGHRDEFFKYTRLQALTKLILGSAIIQDAVLPALGEYADTPRIVFVHGRFSALLSRLPGNISIEYGPALPASLGVLARAPVPALNALLAEDGVTLSVADGADGGDILLIYLAPDTGSDHCPTSHPANAVALSNGATLKMIEIFVGTGRYVANPVLRVTLAENAGLTHLRVQNESEHAYHLARIDAEMSASAQYTLYVLNRGSVLARLEILARLAGPHASLSLNAVQKLSGSQHGDITSIIRHDAPDTQSRETVRNVLDGQARGVFQGRVEVARGAQKTDAYQMNQTLLLSSQAEIDSKPELEIFADDVKCSHGATIGALDEDQIFYLQSRGIAQIQARALLIEAFASEILDGISDKKMRLFARHGFADGDLA
jgi:Fe-S cluster assembly protein SufD